MRHHAWQQQHVEEQECGPSPVEYSPERESGLPITHGHAPGVGGAIHSQSRQGAHIATRYEQDDERVEVVVHCSTNSTGVIEVTAGEC